MPKPTPVPLIGPSYNLRNKRASLQRTVNLIPVPIEAGNERSAWVFRDVPGLETFDLTPPEPELEAFVLMEDGAYVLMEDGSRILME